jgi:LuxR family maltose regulon positive regulatory protein
MNHGILPGDLLATKLKTPILRSMLVRRERLTKLLRKGMQLKLTVIIAPAGYGKTTLLGEWLSTVSNSRWPVCWVSLDTHDNDPLQFWSYIVASLRTIQPSLQFNIHEALMPGGDYGDCTRLNPLLNEINDIQQQFSLVLDDFHEIQDETIQPTLGYFIDHLPENCHLIISGRSIPHLTLSRLRARRQMVEISSQELSFNLEETNIFLSQVMNLEMSFKEVNSLLDMTGGWIAGLQLAALSLQGQQDSLSFLSSLNKSHKHIADYLTEEVLNHQTEIVKDFLLKTSILEELSPPLCNHILGKENSRGILEMLEQNNLFIIPLDEHRAWYRYHALFGDLLRSRLDQTHPGMARQLHLSAYEWLKENNYPEKAVTHALAAGEAELAAQLVKACVLEAIIHMDLATVVQWYNLLPQALVKKHLQLVLYKALADLMIGKVENIEEELNFVEQNLQKKQRGDLPSQDIDRLQRYVNSIRVAALCTQGNFSQGIRSSQQVLENLFPEDYFFLGLIEHYLAYAYQAAGRLADGAAAQQRACQNALRHNFHKEYVLSQSEKARFLRLQGRLHQASQAYQQAIEHAIERHLDMDMRVIPLTGLSDIYREWNQISAADDHMVEPIRFFIRQPEKNLDWFYTIDACISLAKNRILHKEYAEADHCLIIAQRSAQTYHFFPGLASEVSAIQIQLWLAQGKWQPAASWLRRKELQIQENLSSSTNPAVHPLEQLTMVRVYLATKQAEKALTILETLSGLIHHDEQGEYLINWYTLKALTEWHLGRRKKAVGTLYETIKLAAPEMRKRIFIDEGAPMQDLLACLNEAIKQGRFPSEKSYSNYVQQLLDQFIAESSLEANHAIRLAKQTPQIIFPLIEPLSERELQILRLLVDGLSAKEVARNETISINTVKAHMKSIYQKLDVHSRKDAINKAIKLHLLDL